jgi:hypothetical protein
MAAMKAMAAITKMAATKALSSLWRKLRRRAWEPLRSNLSRAMKPLAMKPLAMRRRVEVAARWRVRREKHQRQVSRQRRLESPSATAAPSATA